MKKNLNASRYTLDLEGKRLPIIIRRHPSSRQMVIRYQPVRHVLSLTLPRHTSVRQGLRFVEEKRRWIEHQVKEHSARVAFADGQVLPVLGNTYTICHIGGRGVVRLEENGLMVPGEQEFVARRVRDWLIRQTRSEITRLVAEKSAQIGKPVGKIILRDTVSHWGSCSHEGNLSFSWRLVFAPYEVLNYIVCHEVAHLAELNHSPAFWQVVASLCPGWKQSRSWVKAHGATLYKYG